MSRAFNFELNGSTSTQSHSKSSLCRCLAVVMIALMLLINAPLQAQSVTDTAYPDVEQVDENGVDVTTGTFVWHNPTISVGDDESGLGVTREIRGASYVDSLLGAILPASTPNTVSVFFGSTRDEFTQSGTTFTPVVPRGQSLTWNTATNTYTYSDPGGTILTFDYSLVSFGNAKQRAIKQATFANGLKLDFYYSATSTMNGGNGQRLQSVISSTGWHVKFTYQRDAPITDIADAAKWSQVVVVTALNNLADPCPTNVNTCPVVYGKYPIFTVGTYDPAQQHYCFGSSRCIWFTFGGTYREVTGVRYPDSTTNNIEIAWTPEAQPKVSQITKEGVTTTYAYSDLNGIRTVTARTGTVTRVYKVDLVKKRVNSVRDELNHETKYEYDAQRRLTKKTFPELNYITYEYDARGNVKTVTRYSKPGTSLPNIVTSATYPASCTGNVACNKPLTTTDARGKVTEYDYDPTHGGLKTISYPAPTAGAVRPQTRYTYQRLDVNGSPSGTGIFKLVTVSSCQKTASCDGTDDEVRKSITYGRNLLPMSTTEGTGSMLLRATTAMAYDDVGNVLTTDGPLAGTADTTRYRYAENRELAGVISPDPDGGGPLKHRAVKYSYSGIDTLSLESVGTVADQSDAAWANFAEAFHRYNQTDANERVIRQTLWSGGTDYAVTDFVYDTRGRLSCSVEYMDPAQWGPQATSCVPRQINGPNGADRVVRTVYDNASRVTQNRIAAGTAEEAVERTFTYTNNNKVKTLTDAENNRTTYEYDGHDRLSKTRFPVSTKGSNQSSTTDYEQLTYENWTDGQGNSRTSSTAASRRLRDTTSIVFSYDNLGRATSKNLPGTDPDVAYGYDNFGRLTSASQPGYALSFEYDALGRQTLDGQGWGSIARKFDLAGRVTRATWWDGFYVDYDRLVTGEIDKIRENGATGGAGVLAAFGYDDIGRRTSITRGNGSLTSYNYDAIARLTRLAHDFAGTADDLSIGTLPSNPIAYNPAGQIVRAPRSNSAYSWTEQVNVTRPYTANGLNQYTLSGTITPTYDQRGNLTKAGGPAYAYTSENLLKSSSDGISLYYDPLGRMTEYDTTVSTRFAYDGPEVAVEIDNPVGNILRRYVRGDAPDEVLVWYEGVGTTDRRWLHADERGSIIAVSDGAGAVIAKNTYDEYGIPGSANVGQFQYTGQMWLGELGMYNYKARIYSPTLGRFMQTDPIGYYDNANLYAYVSNDPLTGTDTSGLGDGLGDAGSCIGIGGCTPSDTAQIEGRDQVITVIGIPWEQWSNESVFVGFPQETTYDSGFDESWRVQLAKLDLSEKIQARIAYGLNKKAIRQNLRRIVKAITGKTYSNEQIDKIMENIVNGPSTTLDGLKELGKISDASKLTPNQERILNSYINDLPNNPLNNEIKQYWMIYSK